MDEHLFSCLEHESQDKMTGANNVRSWHSMRAKIHEESAKLTESQRRIRKHKQEIDFIGDVMRRRIARKQAAAAQTKKDNAGKKQKDMSYVDSEWDFRGKQHTCDHTRNGGPFGHSIIRSMPFEKTTNSVLKGINDVDKQLLDQEWALRTPNPSTEISKYIDIVLKSKVNPFPKNI
jgi:hypothetical protein